MARVQTAVLLSLALVSCSAFQRVAAEEVPDFAKTTLSGDWGGRRSEAWQSGWAFDGTVIVDALRNRGGQRNGGGAMTNIDLGVTADLEQLAGWNGATVYVNVLYSGGSRVNASYTGSLMGVSSIEVDVPTARLLQAWIQQNFINDQFSLLAGIYPIDSEFYAMESASVLIHPAFGTPGDLALTYVPSEFNHAAPGLRAKWLSADRTLYGMAAVTNGVAGDPDYTKSYFFRSSGGQGAFVIGEFGWKPRETGITLKPVEPVRTVPTEELYDYERFQPEGKYAVGLWRYSKPPPGQYAVDADGEPAQGHSQGGYVLAENTLFGLGEKGRDVSAFARYSWSNGLATAIDRTWNVGVRVRGPLASRPDDVLVFGAIYGGLSSGYRSTQAAGGNLTASSENVLEVTWRAALTRYFAVQPVAQWIRHPGGGADAERATVFGVRLQLVL
ncbi:MAG: carbohydrate porin [Thiobacillaceae bacterium]|jgi:porin|nr:carbohydrate porin [Thiobacillaceae bacterium]MCU0989495.1 carbohydrate porin [Xanthomonadales bacterium]